MASAPHEIAADTVRFLDENGRFAPTASAEPYLERLDALGDDDHTTFLRDMRFSRALDTEATNLQRQGQMALWPPSRGQEGAQVGSGRAARAQDHIFPSYREHIVPVIRGVDPIDIVRLMKGLSNGGWDPTDPSNGNTHLYTLVLAAQTLHATGYAMGIGLDGACATGDVDRDEAVLVYFGDGSTSEGDASESLVFAASYQTPQVFFLQNNHWAISVPVERQSRVPLVNRPGGFGIPGVQIDGNDVLASYAVTAHHLDEARSGLGPAYIEALTYRMGAHTTSDDPTKYRLNDEVDYWSTRDPIARFDAYLLAKGADEALLARADADAADFASDVRRRALALQPPGREEIFDHVYAQDHPRIDEQSAWLDDYERQMEAE
ncbi:thiamine pyrophosphate-dependent enzyme [Mycetocola reblochoni]|uniref:2-oxoisovalerate dehydrogenase subunit alpha n=2 Tax=Mycetocola reblochoni TaxID=331618 RepID=A0A1R4JMH1_9MICO|nr:thiamine pyrophosphate-dependent enzyme [Mycetocola reblochoni]RLP68579.1 pyruvate dehydrogenase (acetyl-transferring) E1 component subunit alpha [Mycetocola reblochoni]SJN33187.1 Pyruvate dehydrogenase E1 component alpha subunit [Mycetocola reblochoni REB411]